MRLVLVEVDELRALLAETLREFSDRRDPSPALVDRAGLARALGVSPASVDRLRGEGLPELRVGDAPRFELEAVLRWLRGKAEADTRNVVQLARRPAP